MPPRKRNKENVGLPARWRHYHGAYYYQVPAAQKHRWDGKTQFKLGTTLTQAYKVWAERLELHHDARNIGQLLDRYAMEIVPTKAPKTQQSNFAAILRLKKLFSDRPIQSMTPQLVYKYLDHRKNTPTAANREVEVLSHAYTKAIEWGLINYHPIVGKVRKLSTPPRDRYIEDEELTEALKAANPVIHAYIDLKLLTGLRRGDLLRLQTSDLKDDGIHVQPNKTAKTTGKRLIIEWSPSLREAVQAAKNARPKDIVPWLFCTRVGKPYIQADGSANAFDSLWQRFMRKAIDKTELAERFTEHDLRAKCGSDATSLEHAQQLLAHADSSTTKRIYRRKAERVKPLK